ncbi:hypothetical protein HYDPIDRAFT_23584 [Hydnomerulius pinastri MD-312]|nr:hypothetical protein HYDPIDRAFT_23584 [Hydnomerulius pinastri MD-312]
MSPAIWVNLSLVTLGLYIVKQLYGRKAGPLPPPGPKPIPIIGNLLDMPKEKPWETFLEWGKEYGDIVSIDVMGQRVIILNSANHALNLLEKKSTITSHRPVLQMTGEMIGWNKSLVLLQYGDEFNEYRKYLHRALGKTKLQKYHPLIERQVHRFLQRLVDKPEDFFSHIRWNSGAIILGITSGYVVRDEDDPYLKTAETAIHYFSTTSAPGAFLVDPLPILKLLPSWFPGTSFHEVAMKGKESLNEMTDKPYEFVKARMEAGTALPSCTAEHLEGKTLSVEAERIGKWCAQTLYSGQLFTCEVKLNNQLKLSSAGMDTVVATIHAFFLAMALYPEVQRRVQAEIDTVVGQDRLPTPSECDQLRYINAMALELSRWFCVAPLAVAHVTTEDNFYEGYFIPKVPTFTQTHGRCFGTQRYILTPRSSSQSGFYRWTASVPKPTLAVSLSDLADDTVRSALGVAFAEMSIIIQMAMVLSSFDIKKVTEEGKIITPEYKQTTGTIRCIPLFDDLDY